MSIDKGMVRAQITWEGLDTFMDYLRRDLPRAFQRASQRTLDRVGDITVKRVKQLVVVRTGLLRSTIRKEVYRFGFETNYSYVGVVAGGIHGVDYAPHVEFGTRFMRPQPYMRPGMAWGMKRMPGIFWEELSKEIEM